MSGLQNDIVCTYTPCLYEISLSPSCNKACLWELWGLFKHINVPTSYGQGNNSEGSSEEDEFYICYIAVQTLGPSLYTNKNSFLSLFLKHTGWVWLQAYLNDMYIWVLVTKKIGCWLLSAFSFEDMKSSRDSITGLNPSANYIWILPETPTDPS